MDYEGMLNDLRKMRGRLRLWMRVQPFLMLPWDYTTLLTEVNSMIEEIQEMIACQLTEERIDNGRGY